MQTIARPESSWTVVRSMPQREEYPSLIEFVCYTSSLSFPLQDAEAYQAYRNPSSTYRSAWLQSLVEAI